MHDHKDPRPENSPLPESASLALKTDDKAAKSEKEQNPLMEKEECRWRKGARWHRSAGKNAYKVRQNRSRPDGRIEENSKQGANADGDKKPERRFFSVHPKPYRRPGSDRDEEEESRLMMDRNRQGARGDRHP